MLQPPHTQSKTNATAHASHPTNTNIATNKKKQFDNNVTNRFQPKPPYLMQRAHSEPIPSVNVYNISKNDNENNDNDNNNIIENNNNDIDNLQNMDIIPQNMSLSSIESSHRNSRTPRRKKKSRHRRTSC